VGDGPDKHDNRARARSIREIQADFGYFASSPSGNPLPRCGSRIDSERGQINARARDQSGKSKLAALEAD
jgi:hypothetical protein